MAKTGKRNYINEILAVKGRLPPESERWNIVSIKLFEIEQIARLVGFLEDIEAIKDETFEEVFKITPELNALQDYPETKYELARYIPVSLIACVEGYFRIVYANLIDEKKQFRENVANFDIHFGLEQLVSIERHSISLGEFVAHFLPCNSIEDINKHMSTITDKDFLQTVKLKYKEVMPPLFPKMSMGDDMISRIKETFERRHTYCHEISPIMGVEGFSRVQLYYRAISEFLLISEYIIEEFLSNNKKEISSRN